MRQIDKSFLLLFFKKEDFLLLLPLKIIMPQPRLLMSRQQHLAIEAELTGQRIIPLEPHRTDFMWAMGVAGALFVAGLRAGL